MTVWSCRQEPLVSYVPSGRARNCGSKTLSSQVQIPDAAAKLASRSSRSRDHEFHLVSEWRQSPHKSPESTCTSAQTAYARILACFVLHVRFRNCSGWRLWSLGWGSERLLPTRWRVTSSYRVAGWWCQGSALSLTGTLCCLNHCPRTALRPSYRWFRRPSPS
jgi:hypothetical protein